MVLHIFGGALIVSRLLHAVGFIRGRAGRADSGALTTYALEVAIPIYVLILRPWG